MRVFASSLAFVSCLSAASWASAQGYGDQQSPPPDLQAGGLAPPPSLDPQTSTYPSSDTEQRLQRAEKEDSGRGLEFFWLNGEIGFEHLGLQTFSADNLIPELVESTQTGPVYGGGIGFRLFILTLGARFRLGDFDHWQLWTLNGELGLRMPIGRVEPYFTFGGGYASIGNFKRVGQGLDADEVDIRGFNVRGGFGIDFYVTPVFSLGANLTGELLVLTRPGVDVSEIDTDTEGRTVAEIYAADGSSIGSGVTLTAVAGLHF